MLIMDLLALRAEAHAGVTDKLSIAAEPLVCHTAGTERIAQTTDWDVPAIMDFMEGYGTDPLNLRSMAIYTFPQPGAGVGTAASVAAEPRNIGNRIYFPVIGIGFPENRSPSSFWTNLKLRHELRHIMQGGQTDPLYNNRWALRAVRVAGILAMAYAAKGCYEAMQSIPSPEEWPYVVSGSLGTCAAADPHTALHLLTPSEIDARVFSYWTMGFNPVQILDETRVSVAEPVEIHKLEGAKA